MNRRYSPVTIFPIFVLVVVIAGFLFAIDSKNRFGSEPLAQVHIAQDLPDNQPPNPTVPQKIELKAPLTDLQYPDTKVISESTSSIRLESDMDTEIITKWYKDKITALGYISKPDVNANSNGNIENRLIASKENEELYIEIKKPNGFLKTAINIEISNPK